MTGTDPVTGRLWKALSPKYLYYKTTPRLVSRGPNKGRKAGGYSSTPLTRTGALLGSIHAEYPRRTRIYIGTDVPYGRFHQLGKGVPKRRFLGVSNPNRLRIASTIRRFLEG